MPKIREIPDDLDAQNNLTLNCLIHTELLDYVASGVDETGITKVCRYRGVMKPHYRNRKYVIQDAKNNRISGH